MKNKYLSATRIAQASYCENKIVLEQRHGKQESDKERIRRERGNEEHLRHHLAAIKYGVPKNDSRCFIATEIYGSLAHETNQLRNYRDTVLLNGLAGSALVATYYVVSPWIVKLLHVCPSLKAPIKVVLNHIVRRVKW